MSKWLSSETMKGAIEIVGYKSMPAGAQTNMDHALCPAGVDTKGRLYVKVSDDDSMILAYCHHCGGRGFHKRNKYTSSTTDSTTGVVDLMTCAINKGFYDAEKKFLVSDALHDHKDLSSILRSRIFWWTHDCFVALSDADFFDMRVNAFGVWIPFDSEEHGLVRLDYRTFVPTLPKWNRQIKYSNDGKKLCDNVAVFNPNDSDIGVVCEDPFSAMKIGVTGYAGVCLSGSEITSEQVLKLSGMFDRIFVWMDNDSNLIRMKSCKIGDSFKLFHDNVHKIDHPDDPKNCTMVQIEDYVRSKST